MIYDLLEVYLIVNDKMIRYIIRNRFEIILTLSFPKSTPSACVLDISDLPLIHCDASPRNNKKYQF